MAKSKQFNDAIVMALLQDIDSALFGGDYKSSASTGIIAMSDIKRNGADKQDIENIVLNGLFDKQNDVFSKIKSNLLSHPELAEKLDKIADDNDLLQEPSEDVEESLYDLRDLFLIYLNDSVQSFRPGGQFPIYTNGEHCDTIHCAKFQNDTLRNNGYKPYGNAWNLGNVTLYWSGYDTENRPKVYDKIQVEQYNSNAADKFYKEFNSKTMLDKNKKYIVNMYYKGSPYLETAYNEGRDGISGTHTGYVSWNPNSSRWEVTHNVHGTIHVDPFTAIQGGNRPYGITAIFEPKKKNIFNKIFGFANGGQFEKDSDFVQVKIGNKEYNLLYLSTRKEMEIGLSGVEEMEDNEGALFDYSDKPQKELSFWMKDTTIPLKICFINKDGMVISVHNGKPLSEESMFEDSEPIYYVIEVKQSENITKGMKTDLMEEDIDEDENAPDEHPELNVNKLYIYGSDGNVQGIIHSGCRIFSRKSTKVIIRKAKRAFASKEDKDYKALGRYVFNEIKAQDNRPEEYVS